MKSFFTIKCIICIPENTLVGNPGMVSVSRHHMVVSRVVTRAVARGGEGRVGVPRPLVATHLVLTVALTIVVLLLLLLAVGRLLLLPEPLALIVVFLLGREVEVLLVCSVLLLLLWVGRLVVGKLIIYGLIIGH